MLMQRTASPTASTVVAIRRLLRHPWVREGVILGGLVTAFLTLLFTIDHTAPTVLDRRGAAMIQAIPWGNLTFVPRLGSDLGGGIYGFYVVPALAGVYFALRRRWRALALLSGVFVLHYVMISPKQFVMAYRPSPSFGVEGAGGLESFPSGHVEWAVSFYGVLAALAWQSVSARWRVAIWPAYALVVLGTIVGRIELGRHWPLDTFAGLLAGVVALRLLLSLHAWPWQPAPEAVADSHSA
jgi:undecaprenyl-diphosphatase